MRWSVQRDLTVTTWCAPDLLWVGLSRLLSRTRIQRQTSLGIKSERSGLNHVDGTSWELFQRGPHSYLGASIEINEDLLFSREIVWIILYILLPPLFLIVMFWRGEKDGSGALHCDLPRTCSMSTLLFALWILLINLLTFQKWCFLGNKKESLFASSNEGFLSVAVSAFSALCTTLLLRRGLFLWIWKSFSSNCSFSGHRILFAILLLR